MPSYHIVCASSSAAACAACCISHSVSVVPAESLFLFNLLHLSRCCACCVQNGLPLVLTPLKA